MEPATKRHYQAAPLEEAIFELFVVPTTGWSDATAHDLGRRFPLFAQREELEDFNVFVGVAQDGGLLHGAVPRARRTRLWNAERSRAVQFGSEMCTYNVRKPYGGFDDHLPVAKEVLAAYLDVMKPKSMGWVGQRYVNLIALPPASAPRSYFEIYPRLPAGFQDAHRPFAVQVETARFEHGSVVANLGLLAVEPTRALYTLDIYARSTAGVLLDLDAIARWQQAAHVEIVNSFELTITAEARTLFKEIPCSS